MNFVVPHMTLTAIIKSTESKLFHPIMQKFIVTLMYFQQSAFQTNKKSEEKTAWSCSANNPKLVQSTQMHKREHCVTKDDDLLRFPHCIMKMPVHPLIVRAFHSHLFLSFNLQCQGHISEMKISHWWPCLETIFHLYFDKKLESYSSPLFWQSSPGNLPR